MRIIVVVHILSFGLGYMAARLTEDDCICEEEDNTVEISKDNPKPGIIKEIVYENKEGELFCPPPNKRRCVIVPKFLPKTITSTSCAETEDELLNLQELYDNMKKFCDPACPEYLEDTTKALMECETSLNAAKGWLYSQPSAYYP